MYIFFSYVYWTVHHYNSSVHVAGWSTVSACNTDTTQNQPRQISNTQRTENKTTNVVIQQHSRKLLMMDILIPETCWAHKKWNKIESDIKLVFYSSITLFLAGFSLKHGRYSKPVAPNLQHTTNREQNDRCGNSTTQSQAPDDGYVNVRNMLSV